MSTYKTDFVVDAKDLVEFKDGFVEKSTARIRSKFIKGPNVK